MDVLKLADEIIDGRRLTREDDLNIFLTCDLKELIGGTPQENAQITRDILSGKETGAKRNVILMNAGIAIYLGKEGITMEEGVAIAKEMIDSGKALEKLEEFIKETNA